MYTPKIKVEKEVEINVANWDTTKQIHDPQCMELEDFHVVRTFLLITVCVRVGGGNCGTKAIQIPMMNMSNHAGFHCDLLMSSPCSLEYWTMDKVQQFRTL
jgi:hypothetical protein